MTIIAKEAVNGIHAIQSQSPRTANWLGEDWLEVPERLARTALECGGCCELTIEDGVLVGLVPTERPAPEPPAMTAEEAMLDLLADVDYRLSLQELGLQEGTT